MGGERRAVRLQCSVQNYAWGRIGQQSAVGRLYALQSKAPVEQDKPYAELWMGTHDSGPSFVVLDHDHGDVDDANGVIHDVNCSIHEVKDANHDVNHGVDVNDANYGVDEANGDVDDACREVNADVHDAYHEDNGCKTRSVLLKDWLSRNPKMLGDKVLQRWGANLPFLFKVLSVEKALSIQAHPDKLLAKQLHQLQPDLYKDANHKPEMAFAITNFEALCGFVSPQELQHTIETVPELQQVLGESMSGTLMNLSIITSSVQLAKSTLKAAFTTIMTASKDVITHALAQLLSRLEIGGQERSLTSKELLVMRLAKQYPGDVGVLAAFFFNYIQLDPGQALYLDANEPHAYLSGECLECMATSDNVVRAGLTPKYIDTKTLCAMLTYKQEPPEILSGVCVDKYTKRYLPPFDEFEMDSCIVPIGQTAEFAAIPGPSIVIVLQGTGDMSELHGKGRPNMVLQSGDVLFVPAGTHFELTANPKSNKDLHFYRAGVNSRVLLGHVNGTVNNQYLGACNGLGHCMP